MRVGYMCISGDNCCIQNVRDLITDTKRLGIPLDFISTHFYNSDPNCTRNDTKYGIH